MTTAELYDAYRGYCKSRCWQLLTEREFQTEIARHIKEVFSILKCHRVRRAGKDRRGFCNITLLQATSNPEV